MRPVCLLVALVAAVAPAAAQGGAVPAVAAPRVPCFAPAPPGSLVPQPRVVVLEIESAPPVGAWVQETSVPGFTGSSYFRWSGPNLFSTPGVDVLRYDFNIHEAGFYRLSLRNHHDDPDTTMENDCWIRVDGGPWEKLFNGVFNAWSFGSIIENTGTAPHYNLGVGLHNVEISGRSFNFRIDRIHLYPAGDFGDDASLPPFPASASLPIQGTNQVVLLGDTFGLANLTPGATQTIWFGGLSAPGFPCGTVIPGLGLSGAGELFLSLSPTPLLLSGPKPWGGPGSPSVHFVPVPSNPAFLGLALATQGLMVDPVQNRIVLTEGLDLLIGDH